MDTEKFSHGPCPVGRALAHAGDAWSMMILRDAGQGLSRFDQFRQSLGIAPNILTRRLAALVESGMLEKRRYSAKPPRDEYVLTGKGRDFLPVLAILSAWGRRHGGEGETSRIIDVETGGIVEPIAIDRVTGAPIGSRPLRLELPG
jgi:DNA-binding HxlR family transcriptional regulator